jgi:hypothetical protein
MEDPRGVEPPCRRLRGGCSTVELRVQGTRDLGGVEPPHHRLKGGHSTFELQVHFTRSFDGQTSVLAARRGRCGWEESNLHAFSRRAGYSRLGSPMLSTHVTHVSIHARTRALPAPGTPLPAHRARECHARGARISSRRLMPATSPKFSRPDRGPQKRRRPPRGSRAAFASSRLTNAPAALWPILRVPEPHDEAGAQTEGRAAMGKLLANT